MKTELEICLSGEWYDCHAPIFMEFKRKATVKIEVQHHPPLPPSLERSGKGGERGGG